MENLEAQNAAKQLEQLWQNWQSTQIKINPPPKEPKEGASGLHWTIRVMLLTAIALGIGVAFRTATAFYTAAVADGNVFLSRLEAFVFVLGVEGGMGAFGFRHAYRAALDGKTENRFYSLFLLVARWFGLLILVAISALAGLWQGFALKADLFISTRNTVIFWLSVMMGAGASIAVFLLFEAAGAEAARGVVLSEKRRKAWEDDLRRWNIELRQSFENQPGVRRLKQLAFGKRAVEPLEISSVSIPATKTPQMPKRSSPKFKRVVQYLSQRYIPGEEITESLGTIAKKVGVSKTYVHNITKLWYENPDAINKILSEMENNE